ncbi:MAG TPA: methyltransferase domain-containing protein [Thermoanaerobaculia bacterium]|nr:methyltransferase domain-containing protein [Thermoanaerobaculia bacterium]
MQGQRGDALICTTCSQVYPSVGGVRLCVANPQRALASRWRALAEQRRGLTASKAKLSEAATPGRSRAALALAERGLDGQLANLSVIERAMAPAAEYLSTRTRVSDPFADFSTSDDSWWSSLNMLPYFYRDWGGTWEAGFLAELFGAAVEEHGGDRRESVAVLGCGACGLAYEMARLFPAVFGVDFAVDSLLLAKVLLDGGTVDVRLNFPRAGVPMAQAAVRLQGPQASQAPQAPQAPQEPQPGRGRIELVVANASRLPFASGALSCVITQYLLDLVPSPRTLAAEIHRVLATGGIWINFSTLSEKSSPPVVRAYDPLDSLDPASFLERSGFVPLRQAMHRYVHLDQSALSEWAMTATHTPILSVARKDGSPSPPVDYFADYFAGRTGAILSMVPRFSSYVGLIEERTHGVDGSGERQLVAVFDRENRRPVGREGAAAAAWLLRQIDGQRTTAEILAALQREHGDAGQAGAFLELLRELQECELIAFRSA